MRRLTQPYNNFPVDLHGCSSDALHEWAVFWKQEAEHYKTLEPDKAIIFQGRLSRVMKEQAKRRA